MIGSRASFAVVGDVHGEARQLRRMLTRLDTFTGRIVFVGDYVNGGPDAAEVVEMLATLAERVPERFAFLCGNHDLAFLGYLEGGDLGRFALTGGIATLSSYLPNVCGDVHVAALRAVPARHVDFLRGLGACWETPRWLVSHAGYDPSRPAARDHATMAHAEGWPIFDDAPKSRVVVCGHYVQRRGPLNSRYLVCLDTGCGVASGPLTAAILPERRFLQVS